MNEDEIVKIIIKVVINYFNSRINYGHDKFSTRKFINCQQLQSVPLTFINYFVRFVFDLIIIY